MAKQKHDIGYQKRLKNKAERQSRAALAERHRPNYSRRDKEKDTP